MAAPQPSGPKRVVVIADDEDDVRLLFNQRFRRECRAGQIAFEYAASGDEALRVIDRLHDSLALILSDINMPRMTGFQLLAELHEQWPELDVYLITAYDNDDYRKQAAELGAAGYFTKPLDFSELKRLLLD